MKVSGHISNRHLKKTYFPSRRTCVSSAVKTWPMKFSTNSRSANLSSAAIVLPGDYGDGVKGLMNVQVGWKRMQSAMSRQPCGCPAFLANKFVMMIIMITRWVHSRPVMGRCLPALDLLADRSNKVTFKSSCWPLQQGNVQSHHDDRSNKVTLQSIMMITPTR